MSYPSLLFTEKASGKNIDRDVFEDVKLSLLFSGEAINAMRVLCPANDIPVRQELFKLLLKTGNTVIGYFKELSELADDIRRLDEALENAQCDNERNYLYLNLLGFVVRFYNLATGVGEGGGALLSRFRSWFIGEVGGDTFKRLEARVNELEDYSRAVRIMTQRMVGDNLWLRLEDPETYVGRLKAAARDLGLADIKTERDTSIQLGPRYINALARLHPEKFTAFKGFYDEFSGFYDRSILSYRYELNFYIEITALFNRIIKLGLPLCWPKVAEERKIRLSGAYDVSLLAKNVSNIVPNDIEFTRDEPFFFLTGANGGGKTTYLRNVAISVLFFLSGCPVCAGEAEIWPVQNVFTHFPKDERFDGDGRFADERRRTDEIMKAQGGNSLVLLNETYSTTNEETALQHTSILASQLFKSGSFGLYITHQHGLAGTEIPFLSVIVDEGDLNRRTYRIARLRSASGSYASDILKRYKLTGEDLRRRFIKAGKS
jgi:hypothetical protein